MAGTTTVRELLIKIGIDAKDVKTGLDTISSSVDSAKGHFQSLVTAAAAVTAALAAVAAATIYQASATSETSTEIVRQATALGMTTDAYQQLSYAFQKFGLDSASIADSFTQLAGQVQSANGGSTQLVDTFGQLGVSAEELKTLSPDQLFSQLADGFQNTTDAATRLQLANQLLGGGMAAKLLPLLQDGSEGLAALGLQASDLGLVMSGDALDASVELGQSIATLTAQGESLMNKIGLAVTPAVERLVESMSKWLDENQDVIDQDIAAYADIIGVAFGLIADGIDAINSTVGAGGMAALAALVAAMGALGGVAFVAFQFAAMAASIFSAVSAAAALVGGFTPLGWIVIAIAAGVAQVVAALLYFAGVVTTVVLVVQDFWSYLNGGDSVFGRLIARFHESKGALGGLSRVMEAFGNVAEAVLGRLGSMWDGFVAGIDAAWLAVQPFVAWIQSVMQPVVDAISEKIGGLLDMAAGFLNGVAGVIAPEGATSQAGTGTYGGSPAAVASTAQAANYAPVAKTSGAASQKSIQVAGSNISISGVGMTMEQVTTLLKTWDEQHQRATADALAGGEM